MAAKFCVVYVTAPRAAAGKIAEKVLKDRLAACVNVVPGVTSYYWWKGKREKGRESLLIIKTRRSLLSRLEARVTALHPYTVPEVISLPIVKGNRSYLAWLAQETR
jgi:periplasmic divalent cation tolerance protein